MRISLMKKKEIKLIFHSSYAIKIFIWVLVGRPIYAVQSNWLDSFFVFFFFNIKYPSAEALKQLNGQNR